MINSRKIPITRNNMFYSEDMNEFDMEIGREYVEEDMNQTVVLFRVDKETTDSDPLYGDTDNEKTVWKTPVEIPCVYLLDAAENKAYGQKNGVSRYLQTGKLKFGVYDATLHELGVDIMYGDYIGVAISSNHMEYFTVSNDGRKNYDNKHSNFGFAQVYRTIECVPVDPKIFNGK